jgi:hypothetical protein
MFNSHPRLFPAFKLQLGTPQFEKTGLEFGKLSKLHIFLGSDQTHANLQTFEMAQILN